ncbi:hypothetical protein HYV49_04765 [Candidatus Pacearchaeota archaeon]|nr:hypothetical protein [Candidatus Pacearchaeota archaeon]
MRAKKGQEEIMGFVVIVVVMTIVLVVFLSFLSKPSAKAGGGKEIENFLDSIVLYTTSCEQDTGFLGLKELIIACNNNEQCLDGRSCDILESNVNEILEQTIQVGPDEKINA